MSKGGIASLCQLYNIDGAQRLIPSKFGVRLRYSTFALKKSFAPEPFRPSTNYPASFFTSSDSRILQYLQS